MPTVGHHKIVRRVTVLTVHFFFKSPCVGGVWTLTDEEPQEH